MIVEMRYSMVYVREPTSGRAFRVLALGDPDGANEYMRKHPGAALIFYDAKANIAYLAHVNDTGTVVL